MATRRPPGSSGQVGGPRGNGAIAQPPRASYTQPVVPYDKSELRLERYHVEVAYHAAYNFWNVRGVIAERWAHGPVFGAASEIPGQVTLLPTAGDKETPDQRLQASYGLRASGLNAEGEKWVPTAQEITNDWFADALEVLRPKRVVRVVVSLFGLYPLADALQASRKLRDWAYTKESLEAVLPPSAQQHRDRFHSAVDFLVPEGDSGTGLSVIVGAVGPPHRGSFFVQADKKRDSTWFMGFRVERKLIEERGIKDARRSLTSIVKETKADHDHVAQAVLNQITT